MRYFLAIILCLFLLPHGALAQDEEDRGFLTRKIEEALSGAGREVRIDGFTGALRSEATFDQMTIADDAGVWLTLQDVSLVWSRAALLRGRLRVDSLTAALLDVARLPQAEEQPAALPAAEAEEFKLALPELPVSININDFEVSRIDLGETVLGEAASLTVKATARLDDDGLFLDLSAERLDDTQGSLALRSNVQRDGGEITIDLDLNEAKGGIASNLLKLPGQPSVDLSLAGTGQIDDFSADLVLKTDAVERVSGKVTLLAEASEAQGSGPDRRIKADLGGDVTALIAPEYQDFFGPDVGLKLDTLLLSDGSINVQDFSVSAEALDLDAIVRLNADLWPRFIRVNGRIYNAGDPVVLPGTDAGLTVETVILNVSFDENDGDTYEGVFGIKALEHTEFSVAQTELRVDGSLDGTLDALGSVIANVALNAKGVVLPDEDTASVLGSEIRSAARVTYTEDQPIDISGLTLSGPGYGLTGDAVIEGLENGFPTQLNLKAAVQDLSRFAGLAKRPLGGAAELSVKGRVTPLSSTFDLDVTGKTIDLVTGIPEADGVLTGQTDVSLEAARDSTGTFVRGLALQNQALDVTGDVALRSGSSAINAKARLDNISRVLPEYQGAVALDVEAQQTAEGWRVDTTLDGPYDSRAFAKGIATGPEADLMFRVSMPDVKPIVPEANGPLLAEGRLWQAETGYQVDVKAEGPFDGKLLAQGLATGPEADLDFELSLPDLAPLVPQAPGPLLAKGRVWQADGGYNVDVDASGPLDANLRVDGLATGPDADLDIDLSMPNITPLVPQARGPLAAKGRVWQSEAGYQVDVKAEGPFSGNLAVEGLATGPDARVTFVVGLPDLSALIAELSGPLSINGDVARAGDNWDLDTNLKGPAGMSAVIAGSAASDASTVDVTATGQLPLGLAAPFIAPSIVQGEARFDLAVKGPPGLGALSGQILIPQARASSPNLRLGLENINSSINLGNNNARLDLEANVAAGGRLNVGGTVNLASLVGDLAIALQQAVVIDPNLYSATVNADVTVSGPLTGGAQISGDVNLDEVNVTIPGTGVTSIGAIPDIEHVGASAAVLETKARAGVLPPETSTDQQRSAPAFPLSLNVNAPSAIFIRGRGLDAEMGGDLQLRGDTNNVISSGAFDLIRGRIDVIGRRFTLDEGTVQFEGDFIPFIRFVTSTEVPDGTASITIEGPADEPEITFSAVPEVPEDEVLALILFGRSASELSAFQALELANGAAILAGRGGVDIIGGIRRGIGLDNLDVTTDEDGGTSVTAGKYITEDIYTDVTSNSEKGADISLNIDLRDSLTAKATAAQDGNSSIGLFFERDY